MRTEGWSEGPEYDAQRRVHDAIRPFMELAVEDRRSTLVAVEQLEFEDELVDAVRYGRGPERALWIDEMRPGLRVGWALGVMTREPGRRLGSETGEIESWLTDESTGFLALVRMRWADGRIGEYHPSACVLRRLDDP